MRILKKYKDGSEYITGGIASVEPNVKYKPEEYDLSDLTEEEFKRFKEDKKDKRLRKKIKKL